MSSEIYSHIYEQILKQGALDIYTESIFMKKNRPAYRMTVVCKKEDMKELQKIIFRETTTIGIRYRHEYRTVLKRKLDEIDTGYGKIKVKKVENDGESYVYPEYESIKEIAMKNNIPLKELYKIKELNLDK